MGKVYSMLSRKMYRFNAENRAHKFLDKDKRVTSPWHPSTQNEIKGLLRETAEFKAKESQKDVKLDGYLKTVYVKSNDVVPSQRINSKRSLPQNRRQVPDTDFGFYEPVEVPEGFCTLKQALKFITDHQGDPNLWTAEKISEEYKLDKDKVEVEEKKSIMQTMLKPLRQEAIEEPDRKKEEERR